MGGGYPGSAGIFCREDQVRVLPAKTRRPPIRGRYSLGMFMRRQLGLGQRGRADSAGNTEDFPKILITGGRYVF